MTLGRTRITRHFFAGEFACHDLTPYPEDWDQARLLPLCETLEVIRAVWSKPIEILSGYRTATWNQKVGGARESQHLAGRAADIRVKGIHAVAVHEGVLRLRTLGEVPLLGGLGLYPHFIHVDIRPGEFARWTGKGIG